MAGDARPSAGRSLGKYRLLRRVGGDEALERYLGEHTTIGRAVEVHCLASGHASEGPAAEQLLREARALGGATHRNLQGVVDMGRDAQQRPYVVYEALRGESLSAFLAQHPHGVDAERAARIVTQILEALRSLHDAGVVLRTLTPDAIMVEAVSPGDDLVKIRAVRGAAFHREGRPLEATIAAGSPRYSSWLAPELRRGEPGLDPRVDLFSVGVILRQLLTGRLAGDDEALSDTARRALARACAPDVDERFATADGFLSAVGLMLPAADRLAREQLPTPDDPLSADLQYLHLRRTTQHGPQDDPASDSRLSLLPVLLTIEGIYRRFGPAVWTELSARVRGAEALLPGSGNTPVHVEKGVPVPLFAEILRTVDLVAGRGDLSLVPSLGEHVARRGLGRLVPDLPQPVTPEALIAGFPYLWSRIARDGRAEVVHVGPQQVRLSIAEQSTPSLEVAGLLAGVLREAMRMGGAVDVEVVLIAAQALGDRADLFGVEWR